MTAVLLAADVVPRGRVVSYGDVGALVGVGPRQVGQIMARHGHEVAWWRVTAATGRLPAPLLPRAAEAWAREGIMLAPDARGCRIDEHRADLACWARDWERARLRQTETTGSDEGAS